MWGYEILRMIKRKFFAISDRSKVIERNLPPTLSKLKSSETESITSEGEDSEKIPSEHVKLSEEAKPCFEPFETCSQNVTKKRKKNTERKSHGIKNVNYLTVIISPVSAHSTDTYMVVSLIIGHRPKNRIRLFRLIDT